MGKLSRLPNNKSLALRKTYRITYSTTICGKIFVIECKIVKTAIVFSLESFAIYGAVYAVNLHVAFNFNIHQCSYILLTCLILRYLFIKCLKYKRNKSSGSIINKYVIINLRSLKGTGFVNAFSLLKLT